MKKILLLAFAIVFALFPLALVGCGNETAKLIEINEDSFDGKTFPFVYINVENGAEIVSKEEYLNCVVKILNTEEEYTFESKEAKIKGRGNSTWTMMPKKSYKLKFSEKIDLFGFGKAKTYTLLANYGDKSLSRNLLAYELARGVGLKETSSAQSINLFVNGEYYGVYLLCEQNEIGKSRVNIESDLADIDTGYLVEIDYWADSEGENDIDYFVIGDTKYAIKDPETDDEGFSSEHMNFIKGYVTNSYNSLTTDYETVKSYIDVESFAKCYIIHELFNCVDIGFSSFYMYKVKGGKLYAGPVWDFDMSSGNCLYDERENPAQYLNVNDPEYLYAKSVNVWYKKLLEFDEFKALVGSILDENKDFITEKIDEVLDYQLEYVENNKANFKVWDILNKYVWPNPKKIVSIKTYEGQVEYLRTWLNQKLNYMESVYLAEE